MQPGSLTSREVRTIVAGAAISVAALLIAFAGIPYSRRWSAREDLIASGADRVERLRHLINDEARLRDVVRTRDGNADARVLVSARTAALAGAQLQQSIQAYAERSRVTINRLDLAGAPDSSGTDLPSIPVSLSAVGDVYGVSEFLSMIQNGSPVVEVKQVTLVSNSSLRGGLLQLSLTLSAPSVIE